VILDVVLHRNLIGGGG